MLTFLAPVSLPPHLASVVINKYSAEVITDTVVERIIYLSDGLKVHGYIARPNKDGIFPVLIWNRGGSGDYGALDDLTAYLILASTAQWGYVVMATQYRGNQRGEGVEDWGGEDVNDAINLISLAEELPYCDVNRIAIEGASRGGMTTYRALTMYNTFRCAITHAGIADVGELLANRNDLGNFVHQKFGGISKEERDKEFALRSAVMFADKLPRQTPILVLHGTDDQVVPISQSRKLIHELKRHEIPHQFVEIEGGQHIALKDGSYRIIDEHRRSWLMRYLAG